MKKTPKWLKKVPPKINPIINAGAQIKTAKAPIVSDMISNQNIAHNKAYKDNPSIDLNPLRALGLTHEDYCFVNRAIRYRRAEEKCALIQGYTLLWTKTYHQVSNPITRENIARNTANTWLRLAVES